MPPSPLSVFNIKPWDSSGTKKGKLASWTSVACFSLDVGPVQTGKRWMEVQLLLNTTGERRLRGILACSSSYMNLPVEHIACTAHVGGCRYQANIFHDLSQHYSLERPWG